VIFPAKKENVHSDAVENKVVVVVLICPPESLSALIWWQKMQQRQEANVDIEVVEGDMYKSHSQ